MLNFKGFLTLVLTLAILAIPRLASANQRVCVGNSQTETSIFIINEKGERITLNNGKFLVVPPKQTWCGRANGQTRIV